MTTVTIELLDDGSLIPPSALKERLAKFKTFELVESEGALQLRPRLLAAQPQTLADFLPYLRSDNLLADTHTAKETSHALFEGQGLATLSLAVADALIQQLIETSVHPLAQQQLAERTA